MSQQPNTVAPDAAYAHVHNQVYSPIFFEKLAQDFGIHPQSEDEAVQMLQMASQLREAHEAEQYKQASAQGSILDAAGQHLNQALGHPGSPAPTQNDNLVKRAAANLARDPGLATAVLTLQAAASGVDVQQLTAAQ